MKSANSDPNLSLRARGLFAYYLEVGRVLSAEEMSASVPEGRDSIRSAISELIVHEYISRTKLQDKSGKWHTTLNFTDAWKTDAWDPVTDDGFSGTMYIDSCTTCISLNNSYKLKVVEVLRTSTTRKFFEFSKEKRENVSKAPTLKGSLGLAAAGWHPLWLGFSKAVAHVHTKGMLTPTQF